MSIAISRRPVARTAVSLCIALYGIGTANAQTFSAVAPTPLQLKPAVDQAFAQMMASSAVTRLLDAVKADHERTIEDLKLLTEIEAPPFKEQKRAEAFLEGECGQGVFSQPLVGSREVDAQRAVFLGRAL